MWDSVRVRREHADNLMANEISQYVKGIAAKSRETFGQDSLNPAIYMTNVYIFVMCIIAALSSSEA